MLVKALRTLRTIEKDLDSQGGSHGNASFEQMESLIEIWCGAMRIHWDLFSELNL